MHYVAAAIFSPDLASVLLIKKNRPPWQAGLWNLIGGKVEAGETPETAVCREVLEEAGLCIKNPIRVTVLGGKAWTMDVFAVVADLSLARSLTDEPVAIFQSDLGNAHHLVCDVSDLVKLALTVAREII